MNDDKQKGSSLASTPGRSKKISKDRANDNSRRQTSKIQPVNCEAAGIKVNDVRLRQLVILIKDGWTQAECAAHFGVTDRTIRNWLNSSEMRNLLAELGRKIDPAVQIGHFMARAAAREAGLLRVKRRAEAEGDHTAIRGYEQQLRHLANDLIRIFAGLGLFRHLTFEGLSEEDQAAKQAELLMGQLDSLLVGLPGAHPERDAEAAEEFGEGGGEGDE